MTEEDANKLGLELLKKVGLESKADVKPNNLSGGQKQRLAIVRAMAMSPDVMLLMNQQVLLILKWLRMYLRL